MTVITNPYFTELARNGYGLLVGDDGDPGGPGAGPLGDLGPVPDRGEGQLDGVGPSMNAVA